MITPAFAVASIRQRWRMMGRRAYPQATALYITADAGGSNGYRSRAWKHGLQRLADDLALRIHVSHFPPGTSNLSLPMREPERSYLLDVRRGKISEQECLTQSGE